MSNLVEILVTAKNLTGPTMAAVNAEVNKTGAAMKTLNKTAMLAAAGFAAIGVESVKMAKDFDSNMALLQTQAGVSADKIAGLKSGVLALAGKVGQDPDSLAESLYHVESNFESMGISSAKALKLTQTAAEGATVGHANLVDVTNALTAAVAANIPGVQNLDQAMGVLNATVGVGDMTMSDLAKAMGTGMVATVKGYGLSIKDVAAGLAVFGDNNIRGAKAGNQLRMTVQSLAEPAAGGATALKSIGLATDTLAKDMQKGGLKLALEDLVAHMQAAGLSSKEQGQVITEAFGKKAGTGLNILVGQMDRLESKYPALDAGAKNFGKSWADTQATLSFQLKSLEMSFEALMITIGTKLMPYVQDFVRVLSQHKVAVQNSVIALAGLAAATIAVATAMKTVAAAKLVWSGITSGAAAAKTAMVALQRQVILSNAAFVTAGGGAKGLGAAFGALSTGTKTVAAIAAIAGLALAAKHFSDQAKQAKISSDSMATGLKQLAAGQSAAPVMAQLAKDADNLHQSLGQRLKSNDSLWDIVTNSGGKTSAAKKDFKELGQSLTDLVTAGKSNEAALALEKINAAGVKVPTKYLKDYQNALTGAKVESDLTAESQGRFGKQAQSVQQALQAQQDVAEGLKESLQALDQVSQESYNSETSFYDAIAKATQAIKDNGRTLSLTTQKGRDNRDALSAVAAATDDYTAKLIAQKASWTQIDAVYKKGYDSLVQTAMGMGDNQAAAEKLANSLLHVPKEVKVQANIDDLEAKLKKAKTDLKNAPSSKRATIEASISQLEAQIRKAKGELASVQSKTVSLNIVTTHTSKGSVAHEGGNYAIGGHVSGPGTGTSDDVPAWLSNGEFVVNAAATRKNRRLLEAINNGIVRGYASGGKVSAAEKSARSSAMSDLTLSYFGSQVYSRNEFQSSTASPSSTGDLVNTLNDWRNKIKAATHGSEESKLVAAFDKFGKSALRNEEALTKVNSQLSSAKDKLSSLKDSFSQLKTSVSDAVVSFGTIVHQTGQPGGPGSVISDLKGNVASAQAFAADLEKLRKMGLNSQSLSEIAQAGVSGGGLETAQRLIGSSKSDISQINSLEKQLQAAGSAAGTSAATGVYGSQIDSATALVNGLQKQQSKLNSVMEKAADAMAKQLKKAMGAKAAGGVVGAAAAGGNRWGRTLVGEYGPEIADLPIGTRVHSAPDTARMLAGRAGDTRPIQVTLMLDSRVVARQLIDPMREEIRHRGGTVQKVLGARP